MTKNIFIAGKEFPEINEFADIFSMEKCNVSVTSDDENKTALSSPDIKVVQWNKGSSISARATVIQAETEIGAIDNAILYFDAPFFASKFSSLSAEIFAPACDSMILGFQYLTFELMKRVQQRKSCARIIFLIKTAPSFADMLRNSSLKKVGTEPANAIVAASEAAFANFAENIAATLSKNDYVSVLLVTGDDHNETMRRDSTLATWLKDYICALDEKKSDVKMAKWIKAGEKLSSGFRFFH